MTTAVEVAYIITGVMALCGAGTITGFVIFRPGFGRRLRGWLSLLAAGLTGTGLFNMALVLGFEGPLLTAVSVAAVVGAVVAIVSCAVLAQTAFDSRLITSLHNRVEAHRRTLERLRRSRAELDERVRARSKEIHEYDKRLRIALRDSRISVFMQDPELRYVWMRNAPDGFSAQDFIGKTDQEVLPPDVARIATEAKERAIASGEDVETELSIPFGSGPGGKRYFELTSEPYYDEAGILRGVLSVSVETTETRKREEQLKQTLLEVSHRTKNQLAVLMSIARRMAASKPKTSDFLPAFEARMRALSISQDVLVERDWAAAPLDRLIRAQLEPYLSRSSTNGETVIVEGPEVTITPTAVQNLGLVLNELALNAFESGAMDPKKGKLEIRWRFVSDEDPKQENESHLAIDWSEKGNGSSGGERLEPKFGLAMAERLTKSALGGSLHIERAEPGIHINLEIGRSSLAD